MIQISEVRMNYQKELIAVEKVPEFSWLIRSDERNVRQKAYHLQIAKDQEFHNIVFDSGRVESSKSSHVEADFIMESAVHYFVRVEIESENEKSDYSPINSFLSGILEKDDWKAKFVSAENVKNADRSAGSYVRKEFCVSKKILEAYLFTTALGIYQCYINGRRIGKEELTPGWTVYPKHLLYQSYEVTDFLNQGENAIGAHLGAGWYKGLMGFVGDRNYYGKQTAFYGQLLIRYTDGTQEWIASDSSWKGDVSPVIFSEIYDGEIYDARLEQPGWNLPGFDECTWKDVKCIPFSKEALTVQEASPVRKMEEIPAQELFQTPEGDTCIDFGQNMAGRVRICAKGRKGDKIELRCFETLDAKGNVYLDNLRMAKQQVKYIFGKDEEIYYEPHFTYQGFRYIQIVNFPGKPEKQYFTAVAVYSDMDETGSFSCSNELLNQFHKNVSWGMKSNFVDIPTDCPQRNERLGWTGDAQIFSRTASYLCNTYSFFQKWLVDLRCEQTEEGGVPHVIPDIITGHEENDWLLKQGTHSASAWADASVLIPWNMYLQFGDVKILKEQYGSMKSWVQFMHRHAENNIWNYKLQFGDWVALDAEEGSYYGATPNDLTCTAYFAYTTGIFAKIAKILGKIEDEKKYRSLYESIVQTFRENFFDKDGYLTAQTQTAHILALYFNLVEEKYRIQTAKKLKELLDEENGHLVTGFMGTPYFCHALSENGYTKEAFELLLKEDFPSWLYQVKKGATTVWEHWDGLKPDGSMWSPDMNSFNHYAYGAVDEWIFRVLGGIDTDENGAGFKHSVIYPHIGGGITYAETSYLSTYGKIAVKWEVRGEYVWLNIRIPVNTTATIKLFAAEEVVKSDGLVFGEKNGVIQAETGSGIYCIVYKWR